MKKLYTLFISIILIFTGYAQDSTMKVVGPGVKYHFVKTGTPWKIHILEIDITQAKIKIETALASNVLGKAFERTSTMAKRLNYDGHFVLGAINGDYFGISDATDPYGFVGNSMIMEGEYVRGVQSIRSLFGVLTNKKPVLELFDFTGKVNVKDTSFVINGINGRRETDKIIVYNEFIGDSTRTNAFGTEFKLQMLDSYVINEPMKFKVIKKEVGIGNMNPEDYYVLSIHGVHQAYFNNNVAEGDTIQLTLGSSPNKGKLATMVGGGPRLIENGVIPADFVGKEGFGESHVNSRHPRTAIGFNSDTTKIFFFEVDGRQPGISEGMSCAEVANYMKRIGCSDAVNLDGGGSSAMVIRGSLMNSPSDGSERSCANIIAAVLEMKASEIVQSMYLTPDNVVIDSSQKKQISVFGTDLWGYDVSINPKDVTWKVEGIGGTVDSLGYFVPSGTGDGIIIGEVNGYSDTVRVSILTSVLPTWTYSALKGNLPTWFSTTGSTERGFAYGKVNGNDRIYLVNRPNILILNAATGDQVGTLSTNGVVGGTYLLNDVEVSDDGVIFAGNLTTSGGTTPFKIYKWLSETSDPVEVINYNGGGRWGDKFSVVGSVAEGTAVIYAALNSSNKVAKWVMQNGAFVATPEVITLSNLTNVGTSPAVYPMGLGNSNFIVNGNSIRPSEYTSNGTFVAVAPVGTVDSRSNAMKYFEIGDKKYLIVYQYGSPNENAQVLNVSKGLANAAVLETSPTLGTKANNIGTSGDIDYREYQPGILIYYVLATNNGFGAYHMAIPLVGVNEEGNNLPQNYNLFQNYPNPFNPSTTIKYALPKESHIKLTVLNILGEEVATIMNTTQGVGVHEVNWNASNIASGIYLVRMDVKSLDNKENFSKTIKMSFLK